MHRQSDTKKAAEEQKRKIMVMASIISFLLLLHCGFLEKSELSLTANEEKMRIKEGKTKYGSSETKGTCHLFQIPKFRVEAEHM